MSEYPFSLDAAHLLYHVNLNVLDVVILILLLKVNCLCFCELRVRDLRCFQYKCIWYGRDHVIFSKTAQPALIFEIMTLICLWDACYM